MMEQLLAALQGMSVLAGLHIYAHVLRATPDRAVAINIYDSEPHITQAGLTQQAVQFLLRDEVGQGERLGRTAAALRTAVNGLTRAAPDPNPHNLPAVVNCITREPINFFMEGEDRPYIALNAAITGKEA